MSAARDLWRKGQHGWPAAYPVAQFPNAPLLLAIGGLGVAAATDGAVHGYAQGVACTGLAAWAWGEATDGVNWFRRGLGVGGLVLVVVRVGELAGA